MFRKAGPLMGKPPAVLLPEEQVYFWFGNKTKHLLLLPFEMVVKRLVQDSTINTTAVKPPIYDFRCCWKNRKQFVLKTI